MSSAPLPLGIPHHPRCFSSGLRLPQGSAAERDRKKFLWYSLYAWGGTAAITALTVVMNFFPAAGPHALHPQIGVVSCWFKGQLGSTHLSLGTE